MKLVVFLRYWIQDIIFVFIIISIMEIILPSNNMKKYINMVVGFLIIIVIISPFIKLLSKDYNMDKNILEKHIEVGNFAFKEEGKLSSIHEQQIKELYIEKMKLEIEEFIDKTSNYRVVDMELNMDEEELGKLEGLEIVIREKKEEEETEDFRENITPVEIQDVSINKNNEKTKTYIELEEGDWLKDEISQNFNIPKENITIALNILKEGEIGGKANR